MSVEITQIQGMRKFLLIPLALCGLPVTGFGQSVEDLASVTVLPGWRDADGTHVTALRIDLAEGWKTYWRAPGDSGARGSRQEEKGGQLGASRRPAKGGGRAGLRSA